MSSELLAECMEQYERCGPEPEFVSFLTRFSSRLLESEDVASVLVLLCAREADNPCGAQRILELLLEEARMGLENDGEYAEVFLQRVERTVQAGIAAGAIGQEQQIRFAGLYRSAGLSVPQSLVIEPHPPACAPAPPADGADADLSQGMQGLARDVLAQGGSAYDLFGAIETMLAAAPDGIRAGLARWLAAADGPLYERCALFMLLSDCEPVRQAIIAGLSERVERAGPVAATAALLAMMRGWFCDGPVQAGLDELIAKGRRRGVAGLHAVPRPRIQRAFAGIMDGVGAQTLAVMSKRGRKTVLALILVKTGHGIRDAFTVPCASAKEAERMVGQLCAGSGAQAVCADTLRVLLEGALADGRTNGRLPAPGFLDVIEACDLFDLRPRELDLAALFDLADPERRVREAPARTLGRWINDAVALDRLAPLAQSWFEDSGKTRAIIASGRTARGIETALRKYLETRRDIWARRFLHTAVMLRGDGDRQCDRQREWQSLTASAFGLMNARALKRIPLMEDVICMTIAADAAKLR